MMSKFKKLEYFKNEISNTSTKTYILKNCHPSKKSKKSAWKIKNKKTCRWRLFCFKNQLQNFPPDKKKRLKWDFKKLNIHIRWSVPRLTQPYLKAQRNIQRGEYRRKTWESFKNGHHTLPQARLTRLTGGDLNGRAGRPPPDVVHRNHEHFVFRVGT